MKRQEFIVKFGKLIEFAEKKGIRFIIFTYHRSAAEQRKMYLDGKSQLDGYKKKSKHQLWRAIDLVILNEKDDLVWVRTPEYDMLGEFWISLGGRWGGSWKTLNDPYHFEL